MHIIMASGTEHDITNQNIARCHQGPMSAEIPKLQCQYRTLLDGMLQCQTFSVASGYRKRRQKGAIKDDSQDSERTYCCIWPLSLPKPPTVDQASRVRIIQRDYEYNHIRFSAP
jgi:hypothetical protein